MPGITLAYPYLEQTPPKTACSFSLSVYNADCLVIAKSIYDQYGEVCVLNLANQFDVGGDYHIACSQNQEESLIERTDLFQSLIQLEGVVTGTPSHPYKYALTTHHEVSNPHQNLGFGEITCLYSPDITVLKLDKDNTIPITPFKINVMSSAAYNLADTLTAPSPELYLIGTSLKIINQLRTAKANNQRHLVLGAFGCGAFCNQPELIADIYNAVLHEFEFQGCFDSICFAIINKETNNNYTAFCRVLYPLTPYTPLYDLLHLARRTQYNHELTKKLASFLIISTEAELIYRIVHLIQTELSAQQFISKKVLFLDDLRTKLLRSDMGSVQGLLTNVLSSPEIKLYYSASSRLHVQARFALKLETLLNRISYSSPSHDSSSSCLSQSSLETNP